MPILPRAILVTGGAGFIGSHTVAFLVGQGHRVRVLDNLLTGRRENLAGLDVELVVGDITDEAAIRAAVAGCSHVIHLAARPGVPESCSDPVAFDHTNTHGTVLVMEAARRAQVERLVFASSSAVYGSTPAPIKCEDQALSPESPYAVSKACNERYGQVYSSSLGLECVGLRYFNVFGPRQDPHGPYAAVIPRFVDHCLRGEALPIYGDGGQSRDFIYVGDVARGNAAALFAPAVAGRAFNIGSGQRTTVSQLAVLVEQILGSTCGTLHLPERPGDVRHSLADTSAAQGALGWAPTAPFDDAMAETVAWYRLSLSTSA